MLAALTGKCLWSLMEIGKVVRDHSVVIQEGGNLERSHHWGDGRGPQKVGNVFGDRIDRGCWWMGGGGKRGKRSNKAAPLLYFYLRQHGR